MASILIIDESIKLPFLINPFSNFIILIKLYVSSKRNTRRVGLVQNELDINRLLLLSHMTVFPCPLCSKAYYVLFSLIDQVREVDGVKTNLAGVDSSMEL